MKINIGTFARSGIEARLGPDIPNGVRAALRHYAQRVEAGRAPVRYPRFRLGEPSWAPGSGLELAVEPEVRSVLREESRGQPGNPSVEQLAAHAVFVYLADLDEAIGSEPPRAVGAGR
jgi:hypothetical protein